MRYLVRHNVLEHRLGGENQSPAEREVSLSRAAAPSAPRIADTDPGHFAPDARRQSMRATRDFGLCPCNQMSTDPTRQTQRIAAHSDFAVDDPDRRRHRVEVAADPMEHPEHRHDGTFYKRHLLRQGFEASLDPSALRR